VIAPAADVKYRRARKIKTKRFNATEPANSARGFFSGPSGFSRNYAPAFVRVWTIADKVGFGPGRFCPLMTQSGHRPLTHFSALALGLAFALSENLLG
jgi:hypothetical protein